MNHISLIKPEFNHQKLSRDFKDIAKSGILTRGKFLAKFENLLKKYLGVKYAFGSSSCTAALHLALITSDIGPGDEVLVSDFSFPASGNVICHVGAKPIFVDINLDTLCLDIEDLKAKISQKSKAILVVHAFGYPANMSEIMKLARKHNLMVIEDAACALGSKHKNKYLGTWGEIGCFSFHPRKNITTGEGGAIVTNNPKIAKKIEILRHHGGIKTKKGWEFIETGYNYRLSELQAALGVQQMLKINEITKNRQRVAQKYLPGLKEIPGLILPKTPKDGFFNFQSFVILLPQNINRDQVIERLRQKNIETVLGAYAMHSQPAFKKFGYKPGDLTNSYRAFRETLTLPLFGTLTPKEQNYIIGNLKKTMQDLSPK